MPGVAAFFAALLAALGYSAPHATSGRAALVPGAVTVPVLVVPTSRSSRLHSCSATRNQPAATGRKVLPVACEQPPRSNVTLPNGATGGLSSLLGGGR